MAVEMNRMSAAARSRASTGVLDRGLMAFACFAFFYLYSNLGLALPEKWGIPLWPSHIYLLVLACACTILVITPAAVEAVRQHRKLIFTLLAYGFLEGVRTIFAPLTAEATQILIYNSEYVLVTISFLVIFSVCTRLERIIQVAGLVVAVNAGINLVEFFLPQLLPVTFTTVPGRAAGFAHDPNESSAYICLALPLTAFFALRLMRYAWYAIALAGVVVTFSRGGFVLWAAAVVITEALKQRETTGLRFAGMILLAVQFLFVGLVLDYAVNALGDMDTLSSYLDDNTRSRLNFAQGDNDRVYLAENGMDMFLNAPLFGNGIGSTREGPGAVAAGVHNMFVLMLAELGLMGGIWIAAFLLSIASYGAPFGALVAILFSVAALFTHNLFEWPAVGMLFALYLAVAKRYNEKGLFNGAATPGSSRTFGPCTYRP